MDVSKGTAETKGAIDAIVDKAVAAEANTNIAKLARFERAKADQRALLVAEDGFSRRQASRMDQARISRDARRAVLVKAAADGVDVTDTNAVSKWAETEGSRLDPEDAKRLGEALENEQEAVDAIRRNRIQERWDKRRAKRTPAEAPEAPEGATGRPEAETPEASLRAPHGLRTLLSIRLGLLPARRLRVTLMPSAVSVSELKAPSPSPRVLSPRLRRTVWLS